MVLAVWTELPQFSDKVWTIFPQAKEGAIMKYFDFRALILTDFENYEVSQKDVNYVKMKLMESSNNYANIVIEKQRGEVENDEP